MSPFSSTFADRWMVWWKGPCILGFHSSYILWIYPPHPETVAFLKHNPAGDWNPGWGVDLIYTVYGKKNRNNSEPLITAQLDQLLMGKRLDFPWNFRVNSFELALFFGNTQEIRNNRSYKKARKAVAGTSDDDHYHDDHDDHHDDSWSSWW